MSPNDHDASSGRTASLSVVLVVGLLVYVFSCGPVLGLAFWLREATGWDGFYYVMFAYYPLLLFGQDSLVVAYIEWWVVEVFGTVGPG